MATTPPPHSSLDTPSTPLHGAKFDSFYRSKYPRGTRQSTRRSQSSVHTPPPVLTSPSASSRDLVSTYSPPSSTHTSPQTRVNKGRRSNPRRSVDQSDPQTSPVVSVNMDAYDNPTHQAEQRALNLGPAMLPTPAKTPRKQDQRKATELRSAARVLFPTRHEKVEDAMPRTKGRKGRKNVGFSLDSSGKEENIQIFTDSKDKVPELDVGDHNPFLDNSNHTESPENRESPGRKGRKSRDQVQEHPQIKDAFHHEKGMVYVL